MFEKKRILVTGGTGSWGYELVSQLLEQKPDEVIVYSRNESSQVTMRRVFDDSRLSFRIGDIRDKESLTAAFRGIDYVFHLAALKHVPVCEEQPDEALKTNVIGTKNVIQASIENRVKKVFYISTDKAANPSNFYGMTKAIGEKLIVNANLLSSDTKFVTVRGGNVLGTNGSVVHVFNDQIRNKGQIFITHMEMTRFFMTLRDAIKMLFNAAQESVGGEIFVLKMPSCRIIDLAEVLIEASGKDNVSIVESGIRPGEKIHEILMSDFESQNTIEFDEDCLVILPTLYMPELREHYYHCRPVLFSSFSSNHHLMNKEEIRDILRYGGFL
ncbi:polysaccharide biosynthesis protein [Paenibacillus sp. KQZ6P-2]|uniref:Polysaccharide biosynthesis protein n=1 Tax=Paenibacillus mangrovi TaxID=2931978 RepID=A0A9X2B3Y4_9BACL|nr:polysaccharide biosynthesis protein [Paenibacillus mangrovi]MCJ8013891.1 polysaccharide biosynthesis protein [Paenibacillus mangrovi]